MSTNLPVINEQFIDEYRNFCHKFDLIAQDLYNGRELDRLAKMFLAKHEKYLLQFPYQTVQPTTEPTSGNESKLIEEDLMLMSGEFHEDKWAALVNDNIDEQRALVERLIDLSVKGGNYGKLIGDIYRRACQACHLRVTYNKCRLKQEDDRYESLIYGRQSIRYDPDGYNVVYWYMIGLGWYLDTLINPKERVPISRVFKQTTLRCIKMNPHDSLAHNLLGRYYYNVAGLTWIERTLAKSLLGCKLEASFKDAENEFLQSHRLKNDWLPTGLWMARCLLAQHRPLNEISEWISFGLKLDCHEPSTEIERDELLELRSKLKLSN